MSKNTNLSFLTDYITADITNGRIGINNASPTVAFDVSGITKFSSSVTAADLIISDTYLNDPLIKLVTTTSGNVEVQMRTATTTYNAGIGVVTSGYDFGLFTNNTTRLSISSAGITTIMTNDNIVLKATNVNQAMYIDYRNSAGTRRSYMGFGSDSSSNFDIWNSENGAIVFGTNNSEKMRILSGGNVGIGETNPTSYKLQVGGTVFANSFLSATGYSYPTINVWTTFYTMAAERGIYSVMIGLGAESFAEWQSYGVVFCQGSTGVFSTQYNSSLVQMRLSGLNIQVILTTGAGFTRELTFKVLRS
jgi:hypothetical protein